MTLSTGLAIATLGWTGVETSWNPGFQALQTADVSATYAATGGSAVPLTQGTHYALSLDAAGNITATPLAMPAAPGQITFSRNTDPFQEYDFEDGESIPAASHSALADRAAMRDQEIRRDYALADTSLIALIAAINTAISIATGGFSGALPSPSAATGDGVTKTFALAGGAPVGGSSNFIVTVNGFVIDSAAYTINTVAQTITFAIAPVAGGAIRVRALGFVVANGNAYGVVPSPSALTGNGATTTFALAGGAPFATSASYLVSVNGLLVDPSAYTVNTLAGTITFAVAPDAAGDIQVRGLGISLAGLAAVLASAPTVRPVGAGNIWINTANNNAVSLS